MQEDWCSYGGGRMRTHTGKREDHMKTPGEDGHLPAIERDLNPPQHFVLGLLACRIRR